MGQCNFQRPMAGRVWLCADLLSMMIERAGHPGAAARLDNGDGLLQAHARCLLCTCVPDCERFLAGSEVPALPPLCPNAAFLSRSRAAGRSSHAPDAPA